MGKRKSRNRDIILPIDDGTIKPFPIDDLLPIDNGTIKVLSIGNIIADIEAVGGMLSTKGARTITDVAADLGLSEHDTLRPRAAKATAKQARARTLNRRQRKFAHALSAGITPIEAQCIAGFKPHRGNAWRLARDPRIIAERDRIQNRQHSNRKRGGW